MTVKLTNGCEAAGPFKIPAKWGVRGERIECGCCALVESVYAFVRRGRLWIRVKHYGFGFCDFEAIADDERESRAGRELPRTLRSPK